MVARSGRSIGSRGDGVIMTGSVQRPASVSAAIRLNVSNVEGRLVSSGLELTCPLLSANGTA